MQVNVLPPAHPAVMTMMSFPEINPQARAWIQNQIHQGSALLNDFGKTYLARASEMVKMFNDGSIERAARAVTRNVKSLLHPNTIIPLTTISEIQSAKPIMQRYVMAFPDIRQIYHKQLCDGYSDTYHDHEPTVIGDDHYDYRRVMNGIVQDTVDADGNPNFKISYYLEDIREGDRELTAEEQFVILDVWDVVKYAIDQKIDPTDIFNSDLGI